MSQRLAKRQKRKVSRDRERVRISEPDLRTPEQIKAAREAARATMGRGNDANVRHPSSSGGMRPAPGTGSAAKTDA
jgi:hypothetical protein